MRRGKKYSSPIPVGVRWCNMPLALLMIEWLKKKD